MTGRTRNRIPLLILTAASLAGLILAASNAAAQQPPPVIVFDYGTIGIDELQMLSPTSVYRPIDMLGTRAGARGWGMGGAYTSLATGIEAIPWNPSGLGWLERPEATGDLFYLRSSGSTTGYPDTFNIPEVSLLNVTRYEVNLKGSLRANLVGAGTAWTLGPVPFAGALSVRRYVDVSYPEEIIEDLMFAEGGSFPVTVAMDPKETGGVDAFAATIGAQPIRGVLAVGANLNVLDGRLKAERETILQTGGPSGPSGQQNLTHSYEGYSVDLGLQMRLTEVAAVGLRYTPKFTVDVSNGSFSSRSLSAPGIPSVVVRAKLADYSMDVPAVLTVGGAVHPLPWLTVAGDVSRQAWSDLGLAYKDPADRKKPTLPLRDVTLVHIGAEARLARVRGVEVPLRAGYRRGPLSLAQLEPKGDPLLGDWMGGEIKTAAITFGMGVRSGRVRYDVSYDVLDYKLNRFYFDAPRDDLINPHSALVNVDRRVSRMRFSATLDLGR